MSSQNNENNTFDEDEVLFEDDVEELRKKLLVLSEAGEMKQTKTFLNNKKRCTEKVMKKIRLCRKETEKIMGCCKSKLEDPANTTEESEQSSRRSTYTNNQTIQVGGKLYNQGKTIRKGMRTGAQLGRPDAGDFKGGFQIMFMKRKIKNYSQTSTPS